MTITFIEHADTLEEMCDKIVAWLRDRQDIAEKSAQFYTAKKVVDGYRREVYVYGEAARFWSEVQILSGKIEKGE